MIKNILVIGGYGGTGKYITEYLLEYHNFKVYIAGRSKEKAESCKVHLGQKYPMAELETIGIDARNKDNLVRHFKLVDLVIIAATIPDAMDKVAEAALEANVDVMDILFRGDIIERLQEYEDEIKNNNRRFITQCGFHPGMIAPTIRMAKSQFDEYLDARVAMAMKPVFGTAESVHELIFEVIKGVPLILQKGQWRKAGYKDMIDVQFSDDFGEKKCYPLEMREIIGLEKELGLSHAGAYAAGFNSYMDNFIFPLAMILGHINVKMTQKICGQLMYNSVKNKTDVKPLVELILIANGIKDGQDKQYKLSLLSDDGYKLTAKAVIACLNQYMENTGIEAGIHLMGQIVDEKRLFEDLAKMGLSFTTSLN